MGGGGALGRVSTARRRPGTRRQQGGGEAVVKEVAMAEDWADTALKYRRPTRESPTPRNNFVRKYLTSKKNRWKWWGN